MSSLQPLSESSEAYAKSFAVFLSRSTVRQAITRSVQDGTKQAMAKIGPNIDMNKQFTVLGIGSGKGEMDLTILQIIAEHLESNASNSKKPAIHSVIIEPNSVLLEEFKLAASSLPPSLTNAADVSFEWRLTTYQEYSSQESATVDKKASFDYIHLVHSIYYMDAEKSLLSLFEDQLRSNGAIFCLIQTEDSYFAKLTNVFMKNRNLDSGDTAFYTEQDLEKIAKKHGWFYDVIKKQFAIDVTICFGEPSEESDLLLDFLSHHINFRVSADQQLNSSFMEFIESLVFVDDKGGMFVKGEMAAVLIFK